jgi:DNA-binding winged helix-turn-helix (wHTH) protein/TolB-like protein/Tfp pilus assembly protein PilF
MSKQPKHFFIFGRFRLDTDDRLLWRDKETVPLTPKVFDTLLLLVENQGRVITKDQFLEKLWPDNFVEEGSLSQNIFLLRKALGEDVNGQQFIETIPKRGYRFVSQVEEIREEQNPITPSSQPATEQEEKVEIKAIPVTTERTFRSQPVWLLLILPLLLGLFCTIYLVRSVGRSPAPATKPEIRTIAVLPFTLLDQKREENLGIGMADTLITRLANTKTISVRPTSAVLKYADRESDTLNAGRELNVDAVLEGKIQQVGERIRVSVQLLRINDGATLWAGAFDEDFTGIFSIQDLIAEKVAASLTLQLSGEARAQLTRHATDNIEAYRLYLKGRYFSNKEASKEIAKSIDYFTQAIAKDANFGLAYAGMADAYTLLGYRYNWAMQKEAMTKAKEAALKALLIDEQLAEAHSALGFVLFRHEWNWVEANKEFKRALALDANCAQVHHNYSRYLCAIGQIDQAIVELTLAQQLDPLSLRICGALGETYYLARQYDQAKAQFQKALDMDANMISAHLNLGLVYEGQNLPEQAVAELLKADQLASTKPDQLASLKRAYEKAGMKGYWQEEINMRRQLIDNGTVSPYRIATIYARLGAREPAFEWLEKAFHDHTVWLAFFRYDPRLDALRADPRYTVLMKRAGLTDQPGQKEREVLNN